jgi:hypothetical protein
LNYESFEWRLPLKELFVGVKNPLPIPAREKEVGVCAVVEGLLG